MRTNLFNQLFKDIFTLLILMIATETGLKSYIYVYTYTHTVLNYRKYYFKFFSLK